MISIPIVTFIITKNGNNIDYESIQLTTIVFCSGNFYNIKYLNSTIVLKFRTLPNTDTSVGILLAKESSITKIINT